MLISVLGALALTVTAFVHIRRMRRSMRRITQDRPEVPIRTEFLITVYGLLVVLWLFASSETAKQVFGLIVYGRMF